MIRSIRSGALRVAALLLAGGLAACSDVPTAAVPSADTAAPSTFAGPSSLTVTNSGGYPLISWSAATGATSYTIRLITYNTLNGTYQNRGFQTLTTTTATSYLDTGHAWTGESTCSSGYYDDLYGGEPGHWYEYSVQANYSNGSSNPDNARHYAYIAEAGCW